MKKDQAVRYAWIDYAKVISICLVISYHIPPRADGFWADAIQMLRMPAFFLIAGYLFHIDKFTTLWSFIKHRSIQLLIPYASFFLLFYALWLSVGRMMVGGDELEISIWLPLREFVLGTPQIVVAPYWFICCLFVIQIVYYLCARHIPPRWLVVVVLLAPYIPCLYDFGSCPWQLGAAFSYLPFYALANICKSHIQRLSFRHLPLCLIALGAALACVYGYGKCSNLWVQSTLYTLGGLLMMPLYILLCKQIPDASPGNKLAAFIGRNTIIILALQNYIIGFILLLAEKYYEWPLLPSAFVTNVCVTMAVLLISIVPILIINRYLPFIIGRGRCFEKRQKMT